MLGNFAELRFASCAEIMVILRRAWAQFSYFVSKCLHEVQISGRVMKFNGVFSDIGAHAIFPHIDHT